MKKLLCVWMLCFAVLNGCTMVDSSTLFSIAEYDVIFYELIEDSDIEEYLRAGNLDSEGINGVYLCPFIKETDYDKCTLFLYVYSLQENSTVFIKQILLTAQDDGVICALDSDGQLIEVSKVSDGLSKGMMTVGTFQKAEDWFYSGNTLKLELLYEVNDGVSVSKNDAVYDVLLIGHRVPLMPT